MSPLHAVGPDDRPPAKKPTTILEAVDAGDRLAELELTHRRIAQAVQSSTTPTRDLAALTRRQLEISKEIDALRRHQTEKETEGVIASDETWSTEAI